MALPNSRVRWFNTVSELQNFLQNDTDITEILHVYVDNNGKHVLIYSVA